MLARARVRETGRLSEAASHAMTAAIVRRRPRPGKTDDDFRRAWYHGTGFGASSRMLTALTAADPREVIVIALTRVSLDASFCADQGAAEAGGPRGTFAP